MSANLQVALDSAQAKIDQLRPEHLRELRSAHKPPEGIVHCVDAMQLILDPKRRDAPTWARGVKLLQRPDLYSSLKTLGKSNITPEAFDRTRVYVNNERLAYDSLAKTSHAAAVLMNWVHGVFEKHRVLACMQHAQNAQASPLV